MAIKINETAPKFGKPFLLQITPEVEDRVEQERRARGLKSRSEALRALVNEGLHRAAILRGKKKSPELPVLP